MNTFELIKKLTKQGLLFEKQQANVFEHNNLWHGFKCEEMKLRKEELNPVEITGKDILERSSKLCPKCRNAIVVGGMKITTWGRRCQTVNDYYNLLENPPQVTNLEQYTKASGEMRGLRNRLPTEETFRGIYEKEDPDSDETYHKIIAKGFEEKIIEEHFQETILSKVQYLTSNHHTKEDLVKTFGAQAGEVFEEFQQKILDLAQGNSQKVLVRASSETRQPFLALIGGVYGTKHPNFLLLPAWKANTLPYGFGPNFGQVEIPEGVEPRLEVLEIVDGLLENRNYRELSEAYSAALALV